MMKRAKASRKWPRAIRCALWMFLAAAGSFRFAAAAEVPAWIGYKGDGSGVFRGAAPPATCDEAKGVNIKWKAALPNWGHGCPIVIGDRVFLTYEGGWGGHDFPVLLCLSARGGKKLWELELNHLSATSNGGVAKAWTDLLAEYRTHYTLFDQWATGDKAGAEKKWADMGCQFGGFKPGYGQLRSLKRPKQDKAESGVFKKAGLMGETWQHGCGMGTSCFGFSYPTPVSEGEAIYVATAFGAFFRISLDGKPEWVKSYVGELGEFCRNGRSPILYKGLLISDVQGLVRAMDCKTGALKWSAKVETETWMSPVIVTAGGSDMLLCFNRKAFRLPDGKELKVEGGTDFGATTVVKYDERDVTFHTGGGEHGGWENKGKCDTPPPSAVRWSLSGETLKGKVLWSGIGGECFSGHVGLLYHQGKLYHRGLILEPLTGKVLAGNPKEKRGGLVESHHLFLVGGDKIYGLKEAQGGKGEDAAKAGLLLCYDLSGKKIGESILSNAPASPEKQKQSVEQVGFRHWRFSYSCPFTIGDGCIYVRSYDYLWCIGK